MASMKEDCSSINSAASREMDREREREREREHENELLLSPSKFKTQTQTKPQAPETGASTKAEKYVRVRDMINLYNFAMQKNQELEHAKSILFGSGQEADCDISGDMPSSAEKEDADDEGQEIPTKVHASKSHSGEKLTVEKSYRSKTTLRRTDQGVRIIIDIYMNKDDSEIDIVGSRVETDIPESRVLAEFQKQSLEMEKLQLLKGEQVQVRKTQDHDQVDKRT
ncbi:uncharacterized protein LOC110191111 [Drosophila serrata]|uniref:uncharacterized protein LOC110191111 n=1 Tax=Drosophila serrata TaxID=7274 RepID=UPI000A1D03D4|nr:uncharacterized protein LOC110191111 [Drosophila serrata]